MSLLEGNQAFQVPELPRINETPALRSQSSQIESLVGMFMRDVLIAREQRQGFVQFQNMVAFYCQVCSSLGRGTQLGASCDSSDSNGGKVWERRQYD